MTSREPFTYTLLQYRHDPFANERVNVGVLLFAPDSGLLLIKVRSTIGRFSNLFVDLERTAFISSLKAIERAARSLAREAAGLSGHGATVADYANRIIADGEGAFAWGGVRSGATRDINAAVQDLYDRYVSRHDVKHRANRDDSAVWKMANELLAERRLDQRLESKTIVSTVDCVEFRHAWKNGAWHCYQALSFDFETSDAMLDKARRWVGQLTVLRDAEEEFKPYFLVGAPTRSDLLTSFNHAISILQKSPVPVQVFKEENADVLVDMIEDQIREHDRHGH